jgi:hypothetical protein
MQRTEKQDIYTRITNQIVSTWKKVSGLGLDRGTPNMQRDELRAHSVTTGSLTAESTFSLCGQAPWRRTSRLLSG